MSRQTEAYRLARLHGLCRCGAESITSRCGDCSRKEAAAAARRKTEKRNRQWSDWTI